MRMIVIKRTEETIVFDVSKIVEAVSRAVESVFDEMVEFIEELERSFITAIHSFVQWLLQCLPPERSSHRLTRIYTPVLAVFAVIHIIACIKNLILVSESVACKVRAIYLLRTQDKSSSHSQNEIVIPYIAA